jgi:cobyrinic acid a,c-diamide synthase
MDSILFPPLGSRSSRTWPARLMISAANRSSGKTTVTLGLAAALSGGGLRVQTFKKGPDYIDPMWLARASGRPCYNLDPHLTTMHEMACAFARRSAGAELALVEGNMGLHDGMALDGSNSNAAVAAALELPVVLVLDTRGTTRGIAPLILGYQAFDHRVQIAGVILNRVGGARHEAKLRAAIEHYTDVAVLGALGERAELAIAERHLGLIPSNEAEHAELLIERIRHAIQAQVDLNRVRYVACKAAQPATAAAPTARRASRVRIGIARDRAFGFYYQDDLEALVDAGAELVPFDCLTDARLPAVDGLFIGGGFPESFAPQLEANVALRTGIRDAIESGLPVHAECGGLMYLARSLTVRGCAYQMAGAIPGDAVMHARAVGRGYVELEPTGAAPWSAAAPAGRLRAHEFHHSSLEKVDPGARFAYRVVRGHGIDGRHDGLLVHNTIASYSHLRSVGGCRWAPNFVDFVDRVKRAPHGARDLELAHLIAASAEEAP